MEFWRSAPDCYVVAVSNTVNGGRAYRGVVWDKLTSAQYRQYLRNKHSPPL